MIHQTKQSDRSHLADVMSGAQGAGGSRCEDAMKYAMVLSKLTNNDIRQIRKARKGGALLREIAEKYDIDVSHTCSICRRRIWRHVK